MNGALAVARYTLVEISRRRLLLVFFAAGRIEINVTMAITLAEPEELLALVHELGLFAAIDPIRIGFLQQLR